MFAYIRPRLSHHAGPDPPRARLAGLVEGALRDGMRGGEEVEDQRVAGCGLDGVGGVAEAVLGDVDIVGGCEDGCWQCYSCCCGEELGEVHDWEAVVVMVAGCVW